MDILQQRSFWTVVQKERYLLGDMLSWVAQHAGRFPPYLQSSARIKSGCMAKALYWGRSRSVL
jgi:hypothetical protein